MRLHARLFPALLPFVFAALLSGSAYSQSQPSPDDLRGSVNKENVYINPALGMTLALPGDWEVLEKRVAQSPAPPPDCGGPLCGNPEIDVYLATKAHASPACNVMIAGYKLAPQYLDRKRNPLRNFARVMMEGSLQRSGFVPIGAQTAIQLDGKPGFRLLVGNPAEGAVKKFGYVSEANGYVFLLVGWASESSSALQSAIEGMKLGSLPKDEKSGTGNASQPKSK
jgi:hypothetical protein